MRDFGVAHPGTTLVLIDYHPDAGGLEHPINSTNWVGRLVADGVIASVLWVTAVRLEGGQRLSRQRWLQSLLAEDEPATATRVMAAYTIADAADLKAWTARGPWVLSIDSDVLAHDAGPDPEGWLEELAAWVDSRSPPLGTWALSSAYQNDSSMAWKWTQAWWGQSWMARVQGRMIGGLPGAVAESPEEARTWRSWANGQPFWPGAAAWQGAPRELRYRLLDLGVYPTDRSARDALDSWSDIDRDALERRVPPEAQKAWLDYARSSVELTLAQGPPGEPEASPSIDLGLAVRLIGPQGDRGCLAWYRGVDDPLAVLRWCASQAMDDPRYSPVRPAEASGLTVEVSVFGRWSALANPLDLRLGWESLLLVNGPERTLLQSSVAVERGYSVELFLERLSLKAGLGTDGWKRTGVHLLRAPTEFVSSPLVPTTQN